MKKLLFLISILLVGLSGCSKTTKEAPKLTYQITSENYDDFFKVEYDSPFRAISITPLFEKHFKYSDIKFSYKNDYVKKTGYSAFTYEYENKSYSFDINLDSKGYGSVDYVPTQDKYSIDSKTISLLSVSGNVSFIETGITIKNLKSFERDYLHQESLGVYYNSSSTYMYKLVFKVDLNFQKNYKTDAFYVIDSVNVKFKGIKNNVQKELEYTFHPNFFGIDEVLLEEDIDISFGQKPYIYSNGFYVYYE